MSSIQELIDRNIELTELLQKKLNTFQSMLQAVSIGMVVILLAQFAMVLYIIYR